MFYLNAKYSLCVLAVLVSSGQCYSLSELVDKNNNQAELKTLVLTHVLFRHGNRTGQTSELYPNDPYYNFTYFPFGNGQLTNVGKVREFSIGEALRKRYGQFLGDYFYPDILEARSTDYNRTKASLLLALAGLFPPKGVEVWRRSLGWQPIPYNYVPTAIDKILIGMNCPTYTKIYNNYISSPKLQAEFSKYQETFDYISKHSGLNVTKFMDIYDLYFGLSTEEEWGFKLPEWTKKVWPDRIIEIAIKEYYVQTGTTELNSMVNGYLIQKILSDTQSKINNINVEHGKKMYLYSAHENNIAELLIFLGVFNPPHIPTYGSYIVFEIHNINNVYGLKVFYQHYVTKDPQLLKLPGCEEFCPMDKFAKLYEEYFPTDQLCGL